jgi:hypothetical protein
MFGTTMFETDLRANLTKVISCKNSPSRLLYQMTRILLGALVMRVTAAQAHRRVMQIRRRGHWF